MPLGQEAGAGEGFGAVPPDMGSQSLRYNLYPEGFGAVPPDMGSQSLRYNLYPSILKEISLGVHWKDRC